MTDPIPSLANLQKAARALEIDLRLAYQQAIADRQNYLAGVLSSHATTLQAVSENLDELVAWTEVNSFSKMMTSQFTI